MASTPTWLSSALAAAIDRRPVAQITYSGRPSGTSCRRDPSWPRGMSLAPGTSRTVVTTSCPIMMLWFACRVRTSTWHPFHGRPVRQVYDWRAPVAGRLPHEGCAQLVSGGGQHGLGGPPGVAVDHDGAEQV